MKGWQRSLGGGRLTSVLSDLLITGEGLIEWSPFGLELVWASPRPGLIHIPQETVAGDKDVITCF